MPAQIIVIDNDPAIRELLTVSLNGAGWESIGYPYEDINLSTLEQLQPDLLILDFSSSDDGASWELLHLLKMEEGTARIPILIITAASQISEEQQGYLSAQYIHLVKKPLDIDTFLPLIQNTLTLATQAGHLFSSDCILPILVVDDTEDLREALEIVLGLEGYQVATAENGLRALDAVYQAEHCLILLDIAMPVMDGFEFLRVYDQQLRPHTPVIILSGEQDIRNRVLPSFVIEVLPKPFEINLLLRAVKKYARTSTLSDE